MSERLFIVRYPGQVRSIIKYKYISYDRDIPQPLKHKGQVNQSSVISSAMLVLVCQETFAAKLNKLHIVRITGNVPTISSW